MIDRVLDYYQITERLGESSLGVYYKGTDLMLDREVVIKRLRPEVADYLRQANPFRVRATALARVAHPNVASFHRLLQQGDDFFLVMELAHGTRLGRIIRKAGRLDPDRALPLMDQLLAAVDEIHRHGLIHGYLSPMNVVVTEYGLVKLMGFGLWYLLGKFPLAVADHAFAASYLAPEQHAGRAPDARTDVYSLGLIFYEMLTGRLPTAGGPAAGDSRLIPLREFAPELPAELEEAVMRALRPGPEARFQSVDELRGALLTAWGTGSAEEPAPQPPELDKLASAASGWRDVSGPDDESQHLAPLFEEIGPAARAAHDFSPPGLDDWNPPEATAVVTVAAPEEDEITRPTLPRAAARAGSPRPVDWGYYAGVGLVILMFLSIPFALVRVGSKTDAPAPAREAPIVAPAASPPAPVPAAAEVEDKEVRAEEVKAEEDKTEEIKGLEAKDRAVKPTVAAESVAVRASRRGAHRRRLPRTAQRDEPQLDDVSPAPPRAAPPQPVRLTRPEEGTADRAVLRTVAPVAAAEGAKASAAGKIDTTNEGNRVVGLFKSGLNGIKKVGAIKKLGGIFRRKAQNDKVN